MKIALSLVLGFLSLDVEARSEPPIELMSCSQLSAKAKSFCLKTPVNPIADKTTAKQDPRSGGAQIHALMGDYIHDLEDHKKECSQILKYCEARCVTTKDKGHLAKCTSNVKEGHKKDDREIAAAKKTQDGAAATEQDATGQEAPGQNQAAESGGQGSQGGQAPQAMPPPQDQAQNDEDEPDDDNSEELAELARQEQDCLNRGMKPQATYVGGKGSITCVSKNVSVTTTEQVDTAATLGSSGSVLEALAPSEADQSKALVFEESLSEYSAPSTLQQQHYLETGQRWLASNSASDRCKAARMIRSLQNGGPESAEVATQLSKQLAHQLGLNDQELNDFDLEFACNP